MTNYYSNIVIAEDHHFLRRGIVNFLNAQPGLCVVAEAEDGLELLEHVHTYSPDIVITDVRMEKMNGVQATRQLATTHPGLPVIAMSFSTKPAFIDEIITAGAVAYILKNVDEREILTAIRCAVKNTPFFCSRTRAIMDEYLKMKKLHKNKAYVQPLTEREKEIVRLICMKKTSIEIGIELHASSRTIERKR